MSPSKVERVLLTGGSGFIASHVLDCLLEHGFSVVVTARSDDKGRRIVDGVKADHRDRVSYSIVEDIVPDGAFDDTLQTHGPFDYAIHTASPYHFDVQDPVRDFLDPAIKGTTGLLSSIATHAPTVRRLVLTSSSAAILNPDGHAAVYDETHWAAVTWAEAQQPHNTYRASKVMAERAAWAFVADAGFSLATINNSYTFGPVQRRRALDQQTNASNRRIRDMVLGRMRDGLEPTAPVFTFVDVRDVALAHVRAMTRPEAGGHRFYVVAGHFSNRRIADVIRHAFPDLAERALPPPGRGRDTDDLPADVYGFDNSRSREMLGLEYRGLSEAVVDTVQSMLDSGILDAQHT